MKKNILIGIIILAVIILASIYFIRYNQVNVLAAAQDNSSTISEVESTRMTITKTLSTSGQIESGLTENIYLHATYYFEEIYVSESSSVKEGENILKYTNGTYMKAPYDCIVTSITIPGKSEMCTNNHYISLKAIQTLQMNLNLDEKELSNIKLGQEAEIKISSNSNKVYNGWVTNINEIATYNSSDSTFTVTVTFQNDNDIKLGMSATCDIILNKVENIVAVPIEAIQTQNKSKYVVLINADGSTENRTVETGISNNAYIEIKSGLEEGKTIQIIKQTSSNTNTQFRSFQSGRQGEQQSGNMPSGGKMQSIKGGAN